MEMEPPPTPHLFWEHVMNESEKKEMNIEIETKGTIVYLIDSQDFWDRAPPPHPQFKKRCCVPVSKGLG